MGFVDTEPISAVGHNQSCPIARVAVATVECHIARIRAFCFGLNKGAHLCLLILGDGERRRESFFWWVYGQEDLSQEFLGHGCFSLQPAPSLSPFWLPSQERMLSSVDIG